MIFFEMHSHNVECGRTIDWFLSLEKKASAIFAVSMIIASMIAVNIY